MKHAELCPICHGNGKLPGDGNTSANYQEKTCHGCGGKGWVEVEGEVVSIPSLQIPPLTPFDFTVTTWTPDGGWAFYPGVQ